MKKSVLSTLAAAAVAAAHASPGGGFDGLSNPDGTAIPGAVFKERDLYADTWDAMDALGRKLGDSHTLPAPRDKQAGIFYWTWHQGRKGTVLDNSELLARDPSLPLRPLDPGWGAPGSHYWGRPVFGYYATTDAWVLRRHAQLLAAAGVDAIVFDATNGAQTWMDSFWTLARTWSEMRRNGIRTPRFAYMLPFWPGEYQAASILQLYRDIYKPGKFRDLWYCWNGRPLIHAHPELAVAMSRNAKLPEADRRDYAEIARFFTFRPLQPSYTRGPERPDHWCWLEAYPQHRYGKTPDGGTEMCGAGVAQNHSWRKLDGGRGLAAMNDTNVFGRAYTGPSAQELRPGETLRFAPNRNPRAGEPRRFAYGDNFAQQLDYALKVNPAYLFITGWNEFIAGHHKEWMGKPGAFPDQYSPEFSRDIEPADGVLQDSFYCQLVQGLRRFRGVRPQRSAAQNPIYRDPPGDVDARAAAGYGSVYYADDSGRNDIIECRVSHDKDKISFTAICAKPLSPRTDKAWMRLFISKRLEDADPESHWNHLHYAVNRVPPPDGHTAILERCTGGWNWNEAARVRMEIDGNAVTVKIPRAAIGQTGRIDIRFKWADNTAGEGGEGDILDFYRRGDAAPDGRFLYRYFE